MKNEFQNMLFKNVVFEKISIITYKPNCPRTNNLKQINSNWHTKTSWPLDHWIISIQKWSALFLMLNTLWPRYKVVFFLIWPSAETLKLNWSDTKQQKDIGPTWYKFQNRWYNTIPNKSIQIQPGKPMDQCRLWVGNNPMFL